MTMRSRLVGSPDATRAVAEGRVQLNGKRYDWETDAPAEWHDVPVGGTLIVEGVSSMRRELGTYWDVAIWVEAPYDVRLRRGVARDGEALRARWTDVWMPEEAEYVAAERPDLRADVVADGTQPFDV